MASSSSQLRLPHTVGAFVLTGMLVASAGAASAHNIVEDRVPGPDAVVTSSPVTVSIGTNDEFLDLGGDARGFAIVGIDDEGLFYGDGCVDIVERRMTTDVPLGAEGTYTIAYQFVSADGHSLSDTYTINFVPGPDHVAIEGQPSTPVCSTLGPASPAPEPAVEPIVEPESALGAPTAEGTAEDLTLPIIAGVIVLVIVTSGLLVAASRARKKRR